MISTSPEGPRFTRSTLPAKTGRPPSPSTSKRFSPASPPYAPGGPSRAVRSDLDPPRGSPVHPVHPAREDRQAPFDLHLEAFLHGFHPVRAGEPLPCGLPPQGRRHRRLPPPSP